ncbi:MAG: TIGR03617 family F420-dependent LLM class oxidoreductase [Acidimicrobiales bacterium]|nr:TIGR03617 family F420-dependent LLM class oxidoreductase [Acidimicrobiales bacterium]
MYVDAVSAGLDLRTNQQYASQTEAAGLDGLWFTESGRTAYLSCTSAVLATENLTVGTGIAVAFPRSPMITAKVAWELAEASGGRFVLGLGTQVKAHVERRYSTSFDHPGPRLREYVLALRSIFEAFQGDASLEFSGDFYRFDLLPPTWSPGPIEHPDIPIYVAAVRPWMVRMAGEVSDGVHAHPFHSQRYLAEVVRPGIAEGAAAAGRNADDVSVVVPVMTATGDTDAEIAQWRERARQMISFYGSTRTYRGVFEQHGWHGVSDKLHELQAKGDFDGMAAQITDEMLEVYAVTATWDGLAAALVERYSGVADRLVMYFAGTRWRNDRDVLERFGDVARQVRALTGTASAGDGMA